MLVLLETRRFFVFDIAESEEILARRLDEEGFVVLRSAVQEARLASAEQVLKPLLQYFMSRYDDTEDEFSDIDAERWSIVRHPRIGKGRHNIHHDPQTSRQHAALVDVAESAGVPALLTRYHGKPTFLRETGVSLTAPQSGEGMEFHSDGPRGENTMLMTINENVSAEQGALMVVTRSHKEYVDGVGHGQIDTKSALARKVDYLYERGKPMLIDGSSALPYTLLHADFTFSHNSFSPFSLSSLLAPPCILQRGLCTRSSPTTRASGGSSPGSSSTASRDREGG
jgi:hypothetical protein